MALPPEDPKGAQRRQASDYRRKHAKELALANAVKVDLVNGITTFKQNVDPAALARAVSTKHYDLIQGLIPWHELHPELVKAAGTLDVAADQAAKAAAHEVRYPDAHRFDMKNPKFADYVQRQTGNLITVVQDGTLQAVRGAVQKAFTHGWSPHEVAQSIKGSIGLNARQAQALINYRASLSTPEKGLSTERIDSLSSGYEKRLLDQRAIMIGRTEVRGAQNAAQQEVWEQAHSDGLISADTQRIWVVDGNPCPELCRPMAGVRTGLYQPWTLPNGKQAMVPSDAHPSCFCIASLDI